MTDAEKLAANPDDDLRAVLADLPRVSKASRSEARHDRECDDGSVLIVTSLQGDDVRLEIVPPPELT